MNGLLKTKAFLILPLIAVILLAVIAGSLRRQAMALDEQIEIRQGQIVRLNASIAESRRFVTSRQAGGDAGERAGFLSAETQTAAAGELQARLRDILDSAQLTFVSSRALPTKTVNGVTFVGVRLDGTGDMTQLQKGLFALETADPKFVIASGAIAAPPTARQPEKTQNKVLRWQFDIYAALWDAAK